MTVWPKESWRALITRKHGVESESFHVRRAYKNLIPLSYSKFKDLQDLCKVLPEEDDRTFYSKLPYEVGEYLLLKNSLKKPDLKDMPHVSQIDWANLIPRASFTTFVDARKAEWRDKGNFLNNKP